MRRETDDVFNSNGHHHALPHRCPPVWRRRDGSEDVCRERKRAAQISDARLKNGAAEERSGDRRKTRTYLHSSCVRNKIGVERSPRSADPRSTRNDAKEKRENELVPRLCCRVVSMRRPAINDDNLVEDIEVFRFRPICRESGQVSLVFRRVQREREEGREHEPFHCIESSTAIIGNIVAMNQLRGE